MDLRQFFSARLETLRELRRPILCMLLLAFSSAPGLAPIRDNDVWAHISSGQWMFEHRGVPATDPFSIDGHEKSWVAYYWIFSLLVYGAHDALGLAGLVLLKLVLGWLIGLLLFRLVRRTVPRFELAIAICCVALFTMYPTLSYTRSWLLTIAFFILVLDRLLMFRERESLRGAWWLPLVFVIWANAHIHFVYGLWAVGLFAIEPLVDRVLPGRSSRGWTEITPIVARRMCLVAACFAATFVNAYGWGLYGVLLNYGKESQYLDVVSEFRSPNFRFVSDWTMLGLGMFAVLLLGWQRKLPTFLVMMFGTATYVGFQSARDAWMLTVVSVAIIANFDWSLLFPAIRSDARNYDWQSAGGVIMVAASFLFAASRFEPYLMREMAASFPEKAAAFIDREQLEGPMFNSYGWGGFLLWRLPNHSVNLDGRAHVHGLAAVDQTTKTWMGDEDWKSNRDLQKARLIVGPRSAPLSSLLRADPGFETAYEDEIAVVFVAVDR